MKRLFLLAVFMAFSTQAFCAAEEQQVLESDINAVEKLDRITAQTDMSQIKRDIAELKRDVAELKRTVRS